jgi:uncharacterized membrane protein
VHRFLPAALTLAAIVWCVTLIAAPYALISDNPRLVSSAAAVYSAAGLICHQRAARSFHLAGVQLPVCGRCAGLYFSGALGSMLGWAASRRPRTGAWSRSLLLLAAVPTAMSVILEFSGLAHPSNFVRAACAVPLGAAAGWIFVQSLLADATTADGLATVTHDVAAARGH